jgi:hypothetical protein
MSKFLITGGCSFSECRSPHIDTWARHLSQLMPDHQHISTAMGCQGNGLISRKLIYNVTKNLGNDILVGVVWSGPDRHDFYLDHTPDLGTTGSGWVENPTKVSPESQGGWVILNHHWEISLSKSYYSKYHDDIGHLVYSYEHILRTQWFLEKHKVPYFMSTYNKTVFPTDQLQHPEVHHLYTQIDHSKFLPVMGVHEWCKDYSGIDFPVPGDHHPGTQQYKVFTEQVIVPFFKERGYL